MNITIGDYKTYDDWGLKLKRVSLSFPETKTATIDLPGADGLIDLTEVLGDVRYNNRDMTLAFDARGRLGEWHSLSSRIANYLHGQKKKVILDSDPGYYYVGRLSFSSEKSNELISEIVITGSMDPYKYELTSSLEEWLWDPFDFETGIVREYKNLVVNGELTLIVPGLRKRIIPVITSSAAMTVSWEKKRFPLIPGINKVYGITLSEGDNELTFWGTGVISLDYRGGLL